MFGVIGPVCPSALSASKRHKKAPSITSGPESCRNHQFQSEAGTSQKAPSGPDYRSGHLRGNVSKDDPAGTKGGPGFSKSAHRRSLLPKFSISGGGHQGGPVPVWGGWAAGRRGEVSPLINTSSSSALFCPAGAGEERTPQFSLGGGGVCKCQVNKCQREEVSFGERRENQLI